MAAPILWAPGQIAFLLQENLHAHKSPHFKGGGGGGILGFGVREECQFYFYWREDFSENTTTLVQSTFCHTDAQKPSGADAPRRLF